MSKLEGKQKSPETLMPWEGKCSSVAAPRFCEAQNEDSERPFLRPLPAPPSPIPLRSTITSTRPSHSKETIYVIKCALLLSPGGTSR